MRSVKDFVFCIFFSQIILSISARVETSGEKKIYDYWTTFANGGKGLESDIFALFGWLIGLEKTQHKADPGYGLGNDVRATIGRRLLETAGLINMTNLECRREVENLLSSLAILNYELSIRCDAVDPNDPKTAACRQRKQDQIEEHVWAIKLLNAWGTPSPGLFVQGQFLWYGSHYQCVGSKVPQKASGSQAARYCLITMGPSFEEWAIPREEPDGPHSLRAQVGACLPPSCVEYDSSELLTSVLGTVANNSEAFSSKMRQTLSRHYVFCETREHRPLGSGQLVVAILICALGGLVIGGTIVEYCQRVRAPKRRSEKRIQKLLESIPNNESIIESTRTTDWLDSIKQRLDFESLISFKSQESLRRSVRRLKWWLHMVTAFSVRMNVGWLASSQPSATNGERPGNRITCLYGIRVITMIWVIVGHTYVFAMQHLSNLVEATERIPVQFFSQLVLNSSLSVDTFLLISGLLNCYMWCLRQKKGDQRSATRFSSWLAYYGHRYLRLVPAYALVIAVVVSGLYSSFGGGPRWDPSRISGVQCDRNTWWRHLLFINNLASGHEHCLPWMWHLAIDVQCYVMAPLFIVPLWKSPKFGWVLIVFAILASALARGLVVGLMRLPTNLMLFLPSDNFRNDFYIYFAMIYQKPYFRCGPYLVGLLTGWTLATKTDQLRMWHRVNWKRKILVWLVIFAFCLWPLFGLYPFLSGGFFSPIYNGIFAGINRTLWSVGLAMIIISCHCQFGCSYLNAVFSWIGWWPFARLTYGVYLVHELVIVYVYFNLSSPITYDGHVSLLAYFAFYTAVSYALALILFVTAEGPTLAAERLLFRRKPGSERKRARKAEADLENRNRRDVDIDRQRMTERWSAFAAASNQSPKSTLSGIQLYKAEEKVRSASGEEAVEVGSKKVGSAESSVQTSISESESVDGSMSVTLKAASCRLKEGKEEV